MKKTLISAAALFVLSLSSANASTINWKLFGSANQLLGDSETVIGTAGNIGMTFSGYATNTTDVPASGTVGSTWSAPTALATALYSKDEGGDENGLGLAADPGKDNEIFKNSFVQIDIAGLLAQKTITALQLAIGSVQSGEGFYVWGSNAAAQPGTLLYVGTSAMDDVSFSLPQFGSYSYISVSASCGNVLLDAVTGTTGLITNTATPEPGTLALGIAGVVLLVFGSLRKARRG